ncbi:hypothetical protein [Bdellovibrio sp. HCB209]|uniref:hypothetical protein n=1 Tax=Bdellovibrio sp. HCB209 TaxID=3394354 RepID=UPI0039B56B5F
MRLSFWMTAFAFTSSLATNVAQAQTVEIMWAGSEHLSLGESGAFAACRDLGISKADCPVINIPRADKKVSFRYGEMLMSADFYNSPDELYVDKRKGIKHVIECTHKEIHGESSASCNNLGTIIAMPKYLGVVTKNYNHFGWYNMKDYVKYHQQAIDKALESYELRDSNPAKSVTLFQQAMVANAFADHYLTDAFSSGHVRVPRVQVVEWAKQNLKGFLKKNRGDLLTMLMHDNESINLRTGADDGLPVANSQGDKWVTRGDGHLHIDENPFDPVRVHPENAVRESVKEVLIAGLYGIEPTATFAAAWIVPFHQDLPMSEKFSPEHQQMTKMKLVNSFFKKQPIIRATPFVRYDLGLCLGALPQIFSEFRKAVNKDIKADPELSRRLPAGYVEAFRNVN